VQDHLHRALSRSSSSNLCRVAIELQRGLSFSKCSDFRDSIDFVVMRLDRRIICEKLIVFEDKVTKFRMLVKN
jgi:hypothetical protein